MSLFRTASRRVRLLPLALAIATACASAEPVATSSLQEYPLYVSSTVLDDWLTEHPTAAIETFRTRILPAALSGDPPIVVANCNDSGGGSLRAAVASANTGDTIDLTQRQCTITLTSGEIVVPQKDLTITGPGIADLKIDGDYQSKHYNRIFHHTGTGTLSISGVTLADSKYKPLHNSGARGGCIDSAGSVTLGGVKVTGCSVVAVGSFYAIGGAIYAQGGVGLLLSSISGNFANAGGSTGDARAGAIYAGNGLDMEYSTVSGNTTLSGAGNNDAGGIRSAGNVYVLSSTISGNYASLYGGLEIRGDSTKSTAKIVNSTISNNTANAVAGLSSLIPITIANSTIAFNSLSSTRNGAGLSVLDASVDLQSSIIAMNTSEIGLSDADLHNATAVTGANNLITSGVGTLPTGTLTSCPSLGHLSDNGGPTLTDALLVQSPAIDAGNNNFAMRSHDQRGSGFPRTVGALTDIGAFEYQDVLSDEIFSSEFENRCN